MARPKKDPKEKKDKRLTHYMTEDQEKRLELVSDFLNEDKTQFVEKAIEERIIRLNEQPPQLRQASHEKIMKEDSQRTKGYICANGHTFWVQWTWPMEPKACPCCGEKEIGRTWNGVVNKGF